MTREEALTLPQTGSGVFLSGERLTSAPGVLKEMALEGETGRVQILGGDRRETVAAVDVDETFELVIRTAVGTERTVHAGEVFVRGLYGYAE